jgi:hypothetical protein
MGTTIVVSTPTNREAYRSLLARDWTEVSLRKALAILWDAVGSQGGELPEWWYVLDPDRSEALGANPIVIERLRHLADVLTHPSIPPMPATSPSASAGEMGRVAETTWTYLILQSLVIIEGDRGFLADAQSALFLVCANCLLPELGGDSFAAHRACLLNAMYSHTFLVWRNKPAHMAYLQAALMDALGNFAERAKFMRESIALTPVTEHSYLTKVQDFWSELVDQRQYAEAELFILSIYHGAPREHLEELQEMFHTTQKVRVGAFD